MPRWQSVFKGAPPLSLWERHARRRSMAAPALSIYACVGEALRFARANWRFVLAVAALGALGQTALLLLLGAVPPLLLVGLLLASIAVHAGLTRAALSGVDSVRGKIGADLRNGGIAMGIVGFLFAIVAIVLAYGAMAVLIAPYAEQAQAVRENEAALRALMERAVSEQSNVLIWSMIVGFAMLLLLTSRLYLALPASIDRGRVMVFETWTWTKGALLRIAGARLLLLGPALIFVGALQSLVGMAMGLGVRDPVALAQSAQANPAAFLFFFTTALFVQIAIYTALEAGLSASLYKALKPQTA
jgi:hypothetical protein